MTMVLFVTLMLPIQFLRHALRALWLLASLCSGDHAAFGIGPAQALGPDPGADEAELQEAGFQDASAPAMTPAPYRYEPGAGVPTLLIPRGERLEYKAYLDLGIIKTQVGTVVQSCTVEEQAPSILMTQSSGSLGETAVINLFASGSYMLYTLESTLETRLLPQDWPRISYQSISKSSQTRRREVLLGKKNEELVSSYRGDTTKGAPKGTRIWRTAKERSVPEGTLDMLSAVFLARSMVREETPDLSFPLIDSDNLWQLRLRRGAEQRMEISEGTVFDVVEVVLEPGPYPGEDLEKKEKKFEGVFGIQGSMHLWVEKHTGIAVRIQGILPVGGDNSLIKIGVDVVLGSWAGTPPEFAEVRASTEKK